MNKLPALFLDRDGVINRRVPGDYIRQPADFIPQTGALEALRLLAGRFGRIVVVTNQAGVGKGLMDERDLEAVHRKMLALAQAAGGRIDGVYVCPHRPGSGCTCRKPATGMALQALADFPDIDVAHSWMVGDSVSDMQLGYAMGMKTALITGKSEESEALAALLVDCRFESLLDFAQFIRRT
ncbi:MAG: HAD family hydrolase [Saprospirales bacterium]|jgi:D-glycero-D-manno-heptose 1,7-bisphosphate phosphatase|nr:HAD family hydrolase [Saprospirales bacterium]MBK8920563.1 HAD family hydrolase [Saprospirales bacterium]